MTARATHEALWNGDNQTISNIIYLKRAGIKNIFMPDFSLERMEEYIDRARNEVGEIYKKIDIIKSDIPKNNTTGMVKVYIKNQTMTHFVLKFNNYIANGNSGYSAILCDATLKGWEFE